MYIKRNTFTTHDKNQGQSQFLSSSHKLVRLHQTMFCGTANFRHIDHEDPNTGALPASPPAPAPAPPPVLKGSKKKASKNPYSTRGLDKFSMVLSELESKKERIMSKAGSRGVAMVRFAYSSSRDSWVPIVVRTRDCEERDKQKKTLENVEEASTTVGVEKTVLDKQEGERVKKGFSWRRYYWALVVVLILVCLVLYGRVFAICCTTVLWYLVPSTAKENDYRKRVTEGKKRMVGADK